MRVTIVSPFDPLGVGADAQAGHHGGVETALLGSARALASKGAEVTVLSTAPRAGESLDEGVRHVRVRRFGTIFRTPLSGAFLTPRDADVVHIPATYPLYSDILLWRASRGGPTVLDYHFDVHPTGTAMAAATLAWRASLARLMRRAHITLTKSADYASSSPGLSRVPPAQVRVVPNGVDTRRFRPEGPREGYVLVVARLVSYKGLPVLLRALETVQREMDAPLVVAGTGPARASLEQEAAKRGLDARFLGFVPDEDLPRLYARAAVTVLPSVNGQEAFGITLLESMACGTPVVASDLPGVRGVARLGGLLAPPGDAPALAEAILSVLRGTAGLPSAAALREGVVTRYGWSAIADLLLAAYRDAEAVHCAS